MKVNIVGAGIIGLSVAWRLIESGHEVCVFDQNKIPNKIGSSVDQHRVIRFPYGAMIGYSRMVKEAYIAWDSLWKAIKKNHYIDTGLLFASTEEGQDWIDSSISSLQTMDIEYQRLSNSTVSTLYPELISHKNTEYLFVHSGGILLASNIVEDLVKYLTEKGVKFHPESKINHIDPSTNQIILDTHESYKSDALIIAAGSWLSKLIPEFKTKVTPSRQAVAYFLEPEHTKMNWQRMPITVFLDENPTYCIPPLGGTCMKIAAHDFTMQGHPDDPRIADEESTKWIRNIASKHYKDFDKYELNEAKTCFYTVANDERFIIDKVGNNNTFVMTGFSGHGFKFGPLLGFGMCDLINKARTLDDIQTWAAGHL